MRMGIEASYRRQNTSRSTLGHNIYPYLLRKPSIPYIPMTRGFIYRDAVLDWFTRRVLAWRVSMMS
jgi:putative transposase